MLRFGQLLKKQFLHDSSYDEARLKTVSLQSPSRGRDLSILLTVGLEVAHYVHTYLHDGGNLQTSCEQDYQPNVPR